ncbi:MAG: hypothetical protein HC844_13685 [Tabrizicola sp.]|nr:hypothetical protein [Tabrizicola sp.]
MPQDEMLRLALYCGGAIVLAWAFHFVSRLVAGGGPWEGVAGQKSIEPSKPFSFAYALIAFSLAAVALTFVIERPELWHNWIVVVVGTAGGISMLFRFLPSYLVTWDYSGVTGPRSVLFPPFGMTQNKIEWGRITALHRGTRSRITIRGMGGTQVSWRATYVGAHALMQELADRRPDLDS